MGRLSGLEIRPCTVLDSLRQPPTFGYILQLRIACLVDILNMVLLLPPAPAALVLAGRAFATLSALSAAAFLLIAVAGPPGAFGEAGRAVVEPVDGEFIGDDGRGEDYVRIIRTVFLQRSSLSSKRLCASIRSASMALRPSCAMKGFSRACPYHVEA